MNWRAPAPGLVAGIHSPDDLFAMLARQAHTVNMTGHRPNTAGAETWTGTIGVTANIRVRFTYGFADQGAP